MSSSSNLSSSSYTTNSEIINYFITLFTSQNYNPYTIINAYDNTDDLDLNGVISIGLGKREILHNGNSKDYKQTIIITGCYLTSEDVNQAKITAMYDYIIGVIEGGTITLDDMAGCLLKGGQIGSDGEINTCTYELQLYMCKD